MGCQGSVYLGDNLTFSICTHDADTGALTDASAAPAYRVYEDETATAILTGTMAVLDTANTTGFYTELIACTAANGFEAGKTYTTYIEATVDGVMGGIAYGFTVERTPLPLAITTGTIDATGATATAFRTDLADADNYWVDALLLLTSGAMARQIKEVGAVANTNGVITLTNGQTFTAAPAHGVTFAIINR